MVNAEHIALIAFTSIAALVLSPNNVKNLAISWNTGFPGGWPTSNLYDDAINSPQSQKLAVGSMVERYVKEAINNTAIAMILFILLNCFNSIYLYVNALLVNKRQR